MKAGPSAGPPAELLEQSKQLVSALRARKAALAESRGRLNGLVEVQRGAAQELAREEVRFEKMTVLRDALAANRAKAETERAAEELTDLVSAVPDDATEQPVDYVSVEASAPLMLPDGMPPTTADPSRSEAGATFILTADGSREHLSQGQRGEFEGGAHAESSPHGQSANERFQEFQDRVRDIEQWKRLGSEGVSVSFVSPAGSEFTVSVVERQGEQLDVVIQSSQGGDARALRSARDEIERRIREAGLIVRTLEVR